MNYSVYEADVTSDIKECLNELGTQPVLFIGSGLSKRYFNAPNWIQLLEQLQKACPYVPHEVGYYLQDGRSLEEIGSEFTEYYRKWAWDNRGKFPDKLFEASTPKSSYIKFMIASILDVITPDSIHGVQSEQHLSELKNLQEIQPHAIITTNYDMFIENIFTDYQPIIGQRILKPDTMSIGEIFKIHGSTNEFMDLVFNKEDYDMFLKKKKYLSAKLLTFFAEHPLLFIGYSANDKNIQRILSDIDEIISTDGDLIPNIYFLEYNKNLTENDIPSKEKVLFINNKEIRIKYIEAKNFDWVFQAFSANKAWDNVHPKLLRALLARTYKLVRSDIPRRSVEVDFDIIERAVSDDQSLPKLYGVAMLDDPSQLNLQYPYNLTQIGEQLGYTSWHSANRLIELMYKKTGVNIKETDNKYHILIKTGKTEMHKYSKHVVELLRAVDKGEKYTIDL
ncbi:SIR2 family protein [Priestia flexa]|uniref:SIR2 family protein n=1 Tax=Priestia flexa TaxID=86664 RepID=A0ABU4J7X4_9BACI|nr:SIR2 family protein [Priestia flexa]MCG7314456.1 SIR2 family protein [Priestia flexa]MDW8517101.1 SIR2 family protein [Priestia flexa]